MNTQLLLIVLVACALPFVAGLKSPSLAAGIALGLAIAIVENAAFALWLGEPLSDQLKRLNMTPGQLWFDRIVDVLKPAVQMGIGASLSVGWSNAQTLLPLRATPRRRKMYKKPRMIAGR